MSHTDKTILVFGATGQQGSAVAQQLLKDGWNVRALVRDPRRAQAEAFAPTRGRASSGRFEEAWLKESGVLSLSA